MCVWLVSCSHSSGNSVSSCFKSGGSEALPPVSPEWVQHWKSPWGMNVLLFRLTSWLPPRWEWLIAQPVLAKGCALAPLVSKTSTFRWWICGITWGIFLCLLYIPLWLLLTGCSLGWFLDLLDPQGCVWSQEDSSWMSLRCLYWIMAGSLCSTNIMKLLAPI